MRSGLVETLLRQYRDLMHSDSAYNLASTFHRTQIVSAAELSESVYRRRKRLAAAWRDGTRPDLKVMARFSAVIKPYSTARCGRIRSGDWQRSERVAANGGNIEE
jgi:hypothetical protein